MKHINIKIILSVTLFLAAGFVLAHEHKPEKSVSGEIKNRAKEVKIQTRETVKEVRNTVQKRKDELKDKNLQVREVFKQQIEQRKEELKTRVNEKREDLKSRVEKKREDLKGQLEKIKDERKKEVVEKIDRRMDELNDRLLNHYSAVLNKLGEVLIRIVERADGAEERGIDVSSVRTAIDEANKSLSTAKAAIETQAEKVYTIQVITEEALKMNVGRTKQTMHDDLSGVRSAVKEVHEAVKTAATTLAQLPRSISTQKLTESPTP